MAWEGGVGGEWLGWRGAHDSTPHDSTHDRAEQRSTVHQLPVSGTYEHNCTFYRDGRDLLQTSPTGLDKYN
jgi:hypothetical protein